MICLEVTGGERGVQNVQFTGHQDLRKPILNSLQEKFQLEAQTFHWKNHGALPGSYSVAHEFIFQFSG